MPRGISVEERTLELKEAAGGDRTLMEESCDAE